MNFKYNVRNVIILQVKYKIFKWSKVYYLWNSNLKESIFTQAEGSIFFHNCNGLQESTYHFWFFRTIARFICCQHWYIKCLQSFQKSHRVLSLSFVLTNPPVLTISSQNIKMFTVKGHTSLKVPVKLIIQSDNTRVVPT